MDAVTGTIMQFDSAKGYGFIKPDDGGKDLFLHVTELRHPDTVVIQPGVTRVAYVLADSPRGPKAVSASVLERPVAAVAAYLNGDGPAPATVASWRALWERVNDAVFERLLEEARANGWVQD
jgi:CspA family cold shock protein